MKQRLADAESDAKRLREAIKVLQAEETPKPTNGRARRQSAKPEVTPEAETVTPEAEPSKVVPLGKLLKMVEANPGTTTTGLAKMTEGDQSSILTLLKEAESDGKVTREGQRRATSWFVTNGA
jgi:hypothetical protein